MTKAKKKTWTFRGDECVAYTKSEARAEFKRRLVLNRIPAGEKVYEVVDGYLLKRPD